MATATGWQGQEQFLFSGANYATIQKYSALEQRLAAFITRGSGYGSRRTSATLKALVGAVAGASKVATATRRTAIAENDGVGPNLAGKVPVGPYTIQSGVTTSADVTRIQNILTPTEIPTFPINKDGIGTSGRTNAI